MSSQEVDTPQTTENLQPNANTKEDEKGTVSIEVNAEDQKSSDEKTDEAKESETFLKPKEEDVTITLHDEEDDDLKDIDTPTLPLPTKKTKQNEVTKSDGTEKRPSMITAPFARLKYDWDHSQNIIEFLARVVCVIFASIGWIVLVGGIPFLSVVELVIGAIYLHDCPADPRIPEYLVVSGIFGTILHGVSVCTKYSPDKAKDVVRPHRRRCLCIEAIVQIFLFVWFIAGCTWVYSIYEPDYENKDHDDYCHKGLYLFTFWMFNLTFIIFIIIFAVALCAIAFIALDRDAPQKVVSS